MHHECVPWIDYHRLDQASHDLAGAVRAFLWFDNTVEQPDVETHDFAALTAYEEAKGQRTEALARAVAALDDAIRSVSDDKRDG